MFVVLLLGDYIHTGQTKICPTTVGRAVPKALTGGCIFIYSRSARRTSFEINCNDN